MRGHEVTSRHLMAVFQETPSRGRQTDRQTD